MVARVKETTRIAAAKIRFVRRTEIHTCTDNRINESKMARKGEHVWTKL
jgi:hypothetical protein